MHELGITQNIVAIAAEHSAGAKVKRLSLAIGQLSAIMPDAIRFCFDVCSKGTSVEGALLEIIELPGIGRCRLCGNTLALDVPFGVCSCGSSDLDIIQGQELTVKELELED